MRLTAFPPIADANAKILILGSMPGAQSLTENRYYAHPRNSFWRIVCDCVGKATDDYEERTRILREAQWALWDVLLHCERPGSLDANIRNKTIVCNDFERFLSAHTSIRTILFNGKAAEAIFKKHVKTALFFQRLKVKPELHCLPSTSPAMASMSYEQKLVIWRQHLTQE